MAPRVRLLIGEIEATLLGVVDHALAAKGLRRRVAARVPYFLVAPALVARTDLVLTLPARLARQAAAAHELRILPTPVALALFAVRMIWHADTNDDLASLWLRGQIQDVARALAPS